MQWPIQAVAERVFLVWNVTNLWQACPLSMKNKFVATLLGDADDGADDAGAHPTRLPRTPR